MGDQVFMFDGEDPRMIQAIKDARAHFKYFWREMSWERRRIVPGHEMSSIKIGFQTDAGPEVPSHEQMWVGDFDFNGDFFTGELLNQPNWVSHLNAGDDIKAKVTDISDWMYAIHGKVYGAYTVNVMRADMAGSERRAHDEAWGLDFGDPNEIEIFYKPEEKKSMFSMFSKKPKVDERVLMNQEHPMCLNMQDSLVEAIQNSKEMVTETDEYGNSMLHREALAGNAPVVKILLQHGADPNLKNKFEKTPVQLAKMLNWKNVLAVFG